MYGCQNGQIYLPMVARRSEQNLVFEHQLRTCFGIALKHNLDTTRQVFCSRSVRISFERVCFRLHPASSLCYIQTFPPRTYQETKDFWTPESALLFVTGLLRPYFAPLESVVSKWPDRPIMVRRSEQNLAFKGPFCRCFGIVLKHSMDTTRHVFCSRSVRISFERVCFRLHPASSLCYVQTFPNQTTYQETEGFWTPE